MDQLIKNMKEMDDATSDMVSNNDGEVNTWKIKPIEPFQITFNQYTTPDHYFQPIDAAINVGGLPKLDVLELILINEGDPIAKKKAIFDNEMSGTPKKRRLSDLLLQMFRQYRNTDIKIVIDEEVFPCHLMPLQCSSEFFSFCTNQSVVHLPSKSVTPVSFKNAYKWILNDSFKSCLNDNNVAETFSAATYLGIVNLMNICWGYFEPDDVVTEDVAFKLYKRCCKLYLHNLEPLLIYRITCYFLPLIATNDFLELNPAEVTAVLSSNRRAVNCETEILMAGMRWLDHNWEEREPYLLDVIKCVRFNMMPVSILVMIRCSEVCPHLKRVAANTEAMRLIDSAVIYNSTRSFCRADSNEYTKILAHHVLDEPGRRRWIYDPNCKYHHLPWCNNIPVLSYGDFEDYMKYLNTKPDDYWRTFITECSVSDGYICKTCFPEVDN